MQHDDFVATIGPSTARLAAAARASGSGAPVPSCPGWTMARLVAHIGRVHRWATAVVRAEPPAPVNPSTIANSSGIDPESLPAWLEEGAITLVDVLNRRDGDAPCWAWGADSHVRFWSRRMAHESAVHRWDAQNAAGEPEPIDAELAVDGIDELFENLPFLPQASRVGGEGETVHLHAIDADGEWMIRWNSAIVVDRAHGKADVAARGRASDLLLLTLGRARASTLEVHGDASILDRWQERVRF